MAHIAQRRFGQNFLTDKNIAKKIVKQAAIAPNETVIEIGPGQGAITVLLSKEAKKVIAIELDRDLIQGLMALTGEHENITIVSGDALERYGEVVADINADPYLVVANIPYNITSAIIRTILTTTPPTSRAVLMVQKEVAVRMTARPGDMSLLALSVQLYGAVSKCFDVAPGSFVPRPSVTSAVVEIVPHAFSPKPVVHPEVILSLARGAFAKKRKLLASNLAETTTHEKQEIVEVLRTCGIADNVRAQDLSVSNWIDLARALQ